MIRSVSPVSYVLPVLSPWDGILVQAAELTLASTCDAGSDEPVSRAGGGVRGTVSEHVGPRVCNVRAVQVTRFTYLARVI